jgi:hypothetical protein
MMKVPNTNRLSSRQIRNPVQRHQRTERQVFKVGAVWLFQQQQ